jgi:acetamidase/formamidase
MQGDGEVCLTALETSLSGTFELVLHKARALAYPRGETPTHWITMGMDPDLDRCMEMALRDMIVLLGEKGGLGREDAYTLCSLAVDFRITQTVNGHKGVHGMLKKSLLG